MLKFVMITQLPRRWHYKHFVIFSNKVLIQLARMLFFLLLVSNSCVFTEPKKLPQKNYGNVVISLENCIFDKEKLKRTASQIDGLRLETEINLRILGCEYIQTAGILLRLPQVAMATGQVIFQRFYYSKSFVKHNMEIVAMACINLASKIEEAPRRVRDVVNVFYHIKQKSIGKSVEPMVLDAKYISRKNNVIKAERRILKELGFCVHVKHPHKMIVMYLQQLELQSNKRLVQTAWNYMNDSLRTDVFVRYKPETIACACIYLSARQLQVVLPENPEWYGVMGATREEMEDISLTILKLYTTRPKSFATLDREVEKCKASLQAAKMKAKGLLADGINSTGGTPQSFSPHSNSAQNSPKGKAESSPGLPGPYKVGNVVTKEESNGTASSIKKENGTVQEEKKSKTRSRSVSSVRSSSRSRSRSKERDRKLTRPRQKDKRRKRDEGRHRPRSHKRRKYSRSISRSRSRSGSYERHHGSQKYRRKSPHRDHSRSDKHYHRDRSRSRSRSYERSSDKYRKTSKRRSGKERR